ncbi:hypothetical protein JKP88DRAFT_321423 [Tribonema minus]|uniref:Uncharacterized protein n=1 Tax=Tribonema minus TaxID=303371 RepID=A0A836CER4_9STRA|nr:hypothetical protein JKP88DRAFT_321423 [Tribonema minus]
MTPQLCCMLLVIAIGLATLFPEPPAPDLTLSTQMSTPTAARGCVKRAAACSSVTQGTTCHCRGEVCCAQCSHPLAVATLSVLLREVCWWLVEERCCCWVLLLGCHTPSFMRCVLQAQCRPHRSSSIPRLQQKPAYGALLGQQKGYRAQHLHVQRSQLRQLREMAAAALTHAAAPATGSGQKRNVKNAAGAPATPLLLAPPQARIQGGRSGGGGGGSGGGSGGRARAAECGP